ncbi:MAG: hypothetical protein R3F31_13175 [Verrucomicrobiales bacterium]|nr:hypothetical protein [Akkermansiaceae bacterium]
MGRPAIRQSWGSASSAFLWGVLHPMLAMPHPAVAGNCAAARHIQFRAFPQTCQLSRGLKHKSGFHHLEAMVLAAMIFHPLTLHLHAHLANRQEYSGAISLEKISDVFSIHHLRITRAPETWRMNLDPRHLKYDQRERPNRW